MKCLPGNSQLRMTCQLRSDLCLAHGAPRRSIAAARGGASPGHWLLRYEPVDSGHSQGLARSRAQGGIYGAANPVCRPGESRLDLQEPDVLLSVYKDVVDKDDFPTQSVFQQPDKEDGRKPHSSSPCRADCEDIDFQRE